MEAAGDPTRPTVAILCGGRGTRLQRGTRSIPKPLVEIGGRPIVWHVVQIYAVQGFRDFVLLTGYQGWLGAYGKKLANGERPLSNRAVRMINEIPGIAAALIVVLVVVRPF